MKTFAIADPSRPHKVVLWCQWASKARKQFHVINGYWDGKLEGEELTVLVTGRKLPGVIVWEGTTPYRNGDFYNEAIAWIEQQLEQVAKP